MLDSLMTESASRDPAKTYDTHEHNHPDYPCLPPRPSKHSSTNLSSPCEMMYTNQPSLCLIFLYHCQKLSRAPDPSLYSSLDTRHRQQIAMAPLQSHETTSTDPKAIRKPPRLGRRNLSLSLSLSPSRSRIIPTSNAGAWEGQSPQFEEANVSSGLPIQNVMTTSPSFSIL